MRETRFRFGLEHMNKFLLLALTICCLALSAQAAVTEIRKDFPAQTALLNNVPALSAPTSTGEYLISGYLDQPKGGAITATLSWLDENGTRQSATLGTPTAVSASVLVRVQANTSPTVSTRGKITGAYDLYVVGLGFWPVGNSGQGGITEPVNFSGWPLDSTTLISTAFDADYYALVVIPSIGSQALSLNWTDAQGPRALVVKQNVLTSTGTGFGLIHAVAGSSVTIKSNCTQGCPTATIVLIDMGTPALGGGPLSDHEHYLLGWTNATYPNQEVVVSQGSTTGIGLFLANITEPIASACNGETLYAITQSSGYAMQVHANCDGTPYSLIFPSFLANGSTAAIETENWQGNFWGSSPTYSAEGIVLEF
jgi:hypothetical protein